ncbi:MAG: 2-hydroxyacyl-CoA dehydratase family protein [Dehalococcoidia bacterium]|nr:2-hydroxyacyl-CoA dehydratase family protein [Dehalococcoidia bacterium]
MSQQVTGQGSGTKTTATKATETARKVRGLVKMMYGQAHEAKVEGKPVAYGMVGSQYDEILRAMDIVPIWTENYAGLCAAKRVAQSYLVKAEADGYSNVICGYVRTGLGFEGLRKELGEVPDAPDGGMEMPNLMLGSSYACDPRFKWFQASGHYHETPVFSHDVLMPPVDADLGEVKDYYISYLTQQLKDVVAFSEKTIGRSLDKERLWEVIRLSDETEKLWWQTYQLRKARPCPMPSGDHFNAFVPGFFMRGTPEALDFYKELYAEVQQRVEDKTGVIPREKYRMMWAGGLPPWHTMWMFNYFEDFGAVFVIDTSYRPFEPVEVPSRVTDPVEYLAWRAFMRATHRYDKARRNSGNPDVELILEMVNDYQVDGMVMHATRSCRATTIGQLHLKNLVQRYVKVPGLQLISDIIDLRDYSEADWKSQIDAFLETVASANPGR